MSWSDSLLVILLIKITNTKRFWLLNDGKLHDSSLRYLFSHKVGYKNYAKANGTGSSKYELTFSANAVISRLGSSQSTSS